MTTVTECNYKLITHQWEMSYSILYNTRTSAAVNRLQTDLQIVNQCKKIWYKSTQTRCQRHCCKPTNKRLWTCRSTVLNLLSVTRAIERCRIKKSAASIVPEHEAIYGFHSQRWNIYILRIAICRGKVTWRHIHIPQVL